ncbi:hypothetical protein CAL12_09565 [Bordetella genomosp. 8]|uniref:Uncharacterized protein n=1 Tax=Bordetella genomosp. 8 TaxID=1416806 RepID=A0A1W6YIY9_9BORD|nr:hypothetical protein [Bordetella genomosp. 8]ARP81066.1 hypothetical protein CAL12_09565 [Bordetella genomosp. 8]
MTNKAQNGQALVEALVGAALLGLLATAVVSISRFQWQGLRASHAARAQAFCYAAGDRTNPEFAHVRVTRAEQAADFTGPGGPRAAVLRRELHVEDKGMVRAYAAVDVHPHRHHGAGLILRRHVAILADAGHAVGDDAAQERIAASRAAWATAAGASHAPARQAQALLKRIDTGWRRPPPDLDWLAPWSDVVPADRRDRAGAGGSASRRP